MPLAEDEHPAGDLGPGGEHEPFRISVRLRAPGRDLHYLHPGAGKYRVDASVNCPALSRTRSRKSAARSPRSISRFRAWCTVQGPSGCADTPRTWTYRVPTSTTKKT